jgi:hypothetical protein
VCVGYIAKCKLRERVGHIKNFFSFSFIIISSDYTIGTQLKQARWKDGTATF